MATTPILRGTDEPILQEKHWAAEWTRGGTYGEKWKGTSFPKMVAKWNGLVYTAQTVRMSYANGISEMEVEWAGSPNGTGSGNNNSIEVTQDRWECPEPRLEKDLLNHPSLINLIKTNLSPSDDQLSDILLVMRQYANKASSSASVQSAEKVFRDALEDYLAAQSLTSPPTALYATAFLRFWRLYANNQTHYQASTYAVRHTTNAPAFWGLNVADLNVNCIYSPAQFMSEATNGSSWIYPLPGRLQFKLAAAVSAFSAVTPNRSNYLIGWLKSPSAEGTVARGRIEIQTQYTLDQWSTDLYPTV